MDPNQGIPAQASQAGPQLPPGLPQMMPQGPLQIALPGELQQIMQEWPAVQKKLTALENKPLAGGSHRWQGFALFLLGGSLMAAAVFVWPYASRLF